jgi:hypothetical protein
LAQDIRAGMVQRMVAAWPDRLDGDEPDNVANLD